MSKVIMGIGLPGSGKTSLLRPLAHKYSYEYICPDEIREEVTGDASDQSRNAEVWEMARERLCDALEQGKNVVFDATFANGQQRREFINFARGNGAQKVQGLFVSVSPETAGERNKLRDRTVPNHVIERMNEFLISEPPVVEDGFDSVFDINEFQELNRAETLMEEGVWVKEFKPKLR
jgi:predicted kinase